MNFEDVRSDDEVLGRGGKSLARCCVHLGRRKWVSQEFSKQYLWYL